MWFKSFSVWLLLKMGYNVLFQDVDLVWFKNPLDLFHNVGAQPRDNEQSLRFPIDRSLLRHILSNDDGEVLEEDEQLKSLMLKPPPGWGPFLPFLIGMRCE